jgi:hypothetical protein
MRPVLRLLVTTCATVVLLGVLAMPAFAAPAAPTKGNPNGAAGQMPAFYDGHLFTINFKEQPSEGVLLGRNQINTIYMCDACTAAGVEFVSVLDAIQGDGFNPLWQEVQIVFTAGHTPVQLTSDTDILAAEASGVITLRPTTEVYRCSVVGPGPK